MPANNHCRLSRNQKGAACQHQEQRLGVRERQHEAAGEQRHQDHRPFADLDAEQLAGQQPDEEDRHRAEQEVGDQGGHRVAARAAPSRRARTRFGYAGKNAARASLTS
jgi:hypothetical protein